MLAVVLTLIAQGVPAVADEDPPVPSVASADSLAPVNRGAAQFSIWSKVKEQDWDDTLERSCIQNGSPACKMNSAQVRRALDDIKKLTQKMRAEILGNKAEIDQLKADRQQRAAFPGAAAAKVVGTIAKNAGNSAVKKLSAKADKIGEAVGKAADATGAAQELTEGTQVAVAKAILSFVPVVGDLWQLGESISNGDVEGGVVAVVSLTATALGVICPPAGAVVAAVLVAYYVGKMLWGWLCSKDRDWVADPPGTAKELFQSGADIKWETRKVKGKDVTLVVPRENGKSQTIQQTLLLDSKWTSYNRNRQPVRYTLATDETLRLHNALLPDDMSVRVWQGGKAVADGGCALLPILSVGRQEFYTKCKLEKSVTVALNRPAVLKIIYVYKRRVSLLCRAPCIYPDKKSSVVNVLSEGKKRVQLYLPYSFAFL
ncbi:hypothetical protein GCM10010357_06760 [Streptomyces luteireticuli]|uniref:Uncharacterized protein n=1 Tax=Streptomyces luteireticuli TaxID=173858 RepID=A0ABP3I304_9ACTN